MFPTTFRTIIAATTLCIFGCTESKYKHQSNEEIMRALLENKQVSEEGYYKKNSNLYFLVKVDNDFEKAGHRRLESNNQIGNGLLKYARSQCNGLDTIKLNVSGMLRFYSGVKNNIYIEIWKLPLEQVDIHIKKICQS
jgi:hypothetical protein